MTLKIIIDDDLVDLKNSPSPCIKTLFGSFEGSGREGFGGGKYKGKWRNLSYFLKV